MSTRRRILVIWTLIVLSVVIIAAARYLAVSDIVWAQSGGAWAESWYWLPGGDVTSYDAPAVEAVAFDSTGNPIVVGFGTGPTLGVPQGNGYDGFVAKLDAATGAQQWVITVGGSDTDILAAVTVAPTGEIYAAGPSFSGIPGVEDNTPNNGDLLIVKLNASGSLLWARKLGIPGWNPVCCFRLAADPQAASIVIAPSGDVLVTTVFIGTEDRSNEQSIVYASFSPEGGLRWVKSLGTSPFDERDVRLARAPSGTIYLAGVTGRSLVGAAIGQKDLFLGRVNPNDGTFSGLIQFGTADDEGLGGLAATDSRVFIGGQVGQTGVFPGQTNYARADSFLAAITLDGSLGWVKQFEPGGGCYAGASPWACNDGVQAVGVSPGDSRVFVTSVRWDRYGSGGSFNDGARPFMVVFDTQGNILDSFESTRFRGSDAYGVSLVFSRYPVLRVGDSEVYLGGTQCVYGGTEGCWTTQRGFLQKFCTFTLDPLSIFVGPEGGTGSIRVDTGAQCGWTATSSASWLVITSGSSGVGSGFINYRIDPLPEGSSARSASITVAGQVVTVKQAPYCADNYPIPLENWLSTESSLPLLTQWSRARGPGYYCFPEGFRARAGRHVRFTLESSAFDAYLALIGPGGQVVAEDDNSGGGTNARIPASGYLVLPETGVYVLEVTSARQLEEGRFKVVRELCPTLPSSDFTRSLSYQSGQIPFQIEAAADCQWEAVSDVSWLTFESGSSRVSGTGTQQITIYYADNPTGRSREGHITINGVIRTYIQAPNPAAPAYRLFLPLIVR